MKKFFQKKSTLISIVVIVLLIGAFLVFKSQKAEDVVSNDLTEEPEIASQADFTDTEKLQTTLNEAQVESVQNCFPEYTTSFTEPFTSKDFVEVILKDFKVESTPAEAAAVPGEKKEFTFELNKDSVRGQVNYFEKDGEIVDFSLQLDGKYLGCNENSCHCEN